MRKVAKLQNSLFTRMQYKICGKSTDVFVFPQLFICVSFINSLVCNFKQLKNVDIDI